MTMRSQNAVFYGRRWAQTPVIRIGGVGTLIEAARKAAADNRQKARSEASRGAFKFAKLHEVASLTYDQDAEAMIADGAPIHRSVQHYLETASAYQRLAEKHSANDSNRYAEAS